MIIKYGKKILKQKCEDVVFPDESLKDLIINLFDEIEKVGNGIGLAACQVGVAKRVGAIRLPKEAQVPNTDSENQDIVLINPEIIETKNEALINEGCLSIPNVWQKIKRFENVTVKNHTLDGEECVIHAEGMLAQAIQHEVDHMNGILFIDHFDKTQKLLVENKLRKIKGNLY